MAFELIIQFMKLDVCGIYRHVSIAQCHIKIPSVSVPSMWEVLGETLQPNDISVFDPIKPPEKDGEGDSLIDKPSSLTPADDLEKQKAKREQGYLERKFRETLEALALLLVTCIGMGVCMQFFPLGVFAVMIFSCCASLTMPLMNIPTYACMLWLVVQVWSFTNNHFAVMWQGVTG